MADQVQAPTASSTAPDIHSLLINSKYITLKPFGRHGNVVVYHVFDGSQIQSQRDTISKTILCMIEVTEQTQDIQVKLPNNGPVLLAAKYGITAHPAKMSILNPVTNAALGELTDTQALDYFSPQNRMFFYYPTNFPRAKCTIRAGPQDSERIGGIHQRMQTVYADYASRHVSGIQRILIMMAMVKLYYCAYLLHITLKPAAILGRMAPAPLLMPTIHYLGPMSNIVMRAVCRSPNSKCIEVLESTSHLIILIIEYLSVGNNHKIRFRDPFGTIHFTSESENNTNAVHTDTGKMLGSFYRSSNPDVTLFFDIHTGTPIMTEQRKHGAHCQFEVRSASRNHAVVAEYTPVAREVLLGVTMTQATPVEHKALILSSASIKACEYYHLFNAPIPDMAAYPFRLAIQPIARQ